MKHRWPKSIHSQVEAVFHAVRAIGESKEQSPFGIRGFVTAEIYRIEVHRFVRNASFNGLTSILDNEEVLSCLTKYLDQLLDHCCAKRLSRKTLKKTLAALGKFEYSVNRYLSIHFPERAKLCISQLLQSYRDAAKKLLPKSSRTFSNRAYTDPIGLIKAIACPTFQLQACLQYEGGMRTEGVGAPSHRRLKNPLTEKGLLGIGIDPVTGAEIGIVESREKGGKTTKHYVSLETYKRLESHIRQHGKLESVYSEYLEAINRAAMATRQNATGRGTHGLKFNFSQERYYECVKHGMNHEQALQQVSLETSHFRLKETLTYTRG